jgi:GNAT superfamily N-acetyltransferase
VAANFYAGLGGSCVQWRQASEADMPLLVTLNQHLIADEESRNRMTRPELETRMRHWLRGEYRAILFIEDTAPVAYALYQCQPVSIYLRQFLVVRSQRRQGIGRQAMHLLRTEVWPPGSRITLDVLAHNQRARAFWHSVGFQEYAITMEQLPGHEPPAS